MKIITLPHRWEWKKRSPAEMPHEIQGKLAYTESDILGGQVHQAVMYEPLASTIGGLIAFIVLVPLVPHGAPLLVDALVLGFLALVARLGWKWFEWTHSLFFFTPYRIIYIHGIVTRKLAGRLASVLKNTMLGANGGDSRVNPTVTLATLKPSDNLSTLVARVGSYPKVAAS